MSLPSHMATTYSGISASGNTRMHVGEHHGDVNTTYHNPSNIIQTQASRSRGIFRGWSEKNEQRRRYKKLVKANEEKQRARIDMLFAQGIDVDYVDSNGYTALHHAAKVGNFVDYLLDRGYDVNARSRLHGPPLSIAAFYGQRTAVAHLVAAHARLDLFGEQTPPALHVACSRGHVDIVRDLLAAGADLDTRCRWSMAVWDLPALAMDSNRGKRIRETPLHHAICAGSADIVRLLLKAGASPQAVQFDFHSTVDLVGVHTYDHTYETPALSLAATLQNREIVELLLHYGAIPTTTIVVRPDFVFVDLMYLDQGTSALHKAVGARTCDVSIVRALIEMGGNVMARNYLAATPLHFAAYCGHTEAAELLLEKGGELMACDQEKRTPLHFAAMNGRSEIAKFLIDKGADPTAKMSIKRTAGYLASQHGHKELAAVLREMEQEIKAARKKPMAESGQNVPTLLESEV